MNVDATLCFALLCAGIWWECLDPFKNALILLQGPPWSVDDASFGDGELCSVLVWEW
jgi:hypothetical protein